ncbi:HEAT repeat domain-containing protein [Saccharibacillus sp. CPCC 101409]|uniref:HEAT repeat domain-containing protein n=1 Tax=Saccharibacillus sp. CPCC 101409 TaxID=3058041 RepID=UPI002670E20F|nr:HEAT repeat domain-containing protein [Saccharibacillus sp. CPCC 101409]MDO3413317.1 HEAT repeat domain-containing protein [Saccharibacillus sp. CPCC 101409]
MTLTQKDREMNAKLGEIFDMKESGQADFALLERYSYDSEGLVRVEAAAAFYTFFDERAQQILLRLANDRDWLVRTEACESLCLSRSEHVLEFLKTKLRRDRSVKVRTYAVLSYGDIVWELDKDRHECLLFIKETRLRETSPGMLLACDKVLYEMGEEEALDRLLDGLKLDKLNHRCSAGNRLLEVVNARNARRIRYEALDWLGRESVSATVSIAVELIDACIAAEGKDAAKKQSEIENQTW